MTSLLTFRALVVDDETAPRLHLRKLLSAHPDVQIVGEAINAHDAESVLSRLPSPPDVIFLDIQMASSDGFSLLRALNDSVHVILVTSYERYALKGFDAGVLDYLLKPVTPQRLAESLRRLRQAPSKEKDGDRLTMDSIVTIGDAEQIVTVPLSDIAGIEAEGNYSRIHTCDGNGSRLMLRNLAEWEALLPAPPFARIDRSFIVNLRHVRDFTKESRNQAWLSFEGLAQTFPIGRTASIRLRAALRRLNHPETAS